MNQPSLSVVIPAYNEQRRLGATLRQITHYLQDRALTFEIVVIDDGSSDGTSGVARAFERSGDGVPLQLLRNNVRKGKGYSVRRGMLAAKAPHALQTDADLSTPIGELPKLERALQEGGYHIAFGSRDVESSQVELHQPRWREWSGKLFNRVMRAWTRLPYRDSQCGFKLFEMNRCRDIFERQRIDDFGYDVEILFIARKWGLSLCEVGVIWRHSAGSTVRLLPHGSGMLLDLARIRFNDLMGRYREPGVPKKGGGSGDGIQR